MYKDDVQVCAILRNFESDSDYLAFGDFWIQKLTREDRDQLCRDLRYFTNYPGDKYLVGKWYYIGRGKSSTVLRDNGIRFFFPLFRAMKLFKTGDIIIPLAFYSWKNKWHETELHGENYALGYGLKGNPYIFEKDDSEAFNIFRNELEKYLEHITLLDMPYRKKPKIFDDVDMRCFLAIHIFLKGSLENSNPFSIIDRLIDYTTALESMYLLRNEDKRKNLSLRMGSILGQDKCEEKQICRDIKKFYDLRSDIVHGSLMDEKGDRFLRENIYKYEDYLRRSILALFDLNLRNKSKKSVLGIVDKAGLDQDFKKDLQTSLTLLKLAR